MAQANVHSPNLKTSLSERFHALAISLNLEHDLVQRWAEAFLAHYLEPQRQYHTLSHINAMVGCFDTTRTLIHDANAVLLAIFFHDWVYDPAGKDNEVQSIQEFEKFAKDAGLQGDLTNRVKYLIQLTITHSIPQASEDEQDTDAELFLDYDLEVLSRSPDLYKTYAQQIRQEYIHFGDEDYRQGRLKVLHSFSKREALYFSKTFLNGNEQAARENIKAEIESLETNETPGM